jgi:tRNA threonylcarbamoyladenosine biosynthesis protein TsaE
MIQLITKHPDETRSLGRWLGKHLPADSIVGLDGDLGVGKTSLAKGMVLGLGKFDEAYIKSPAYNLVHQYDLENAGSASTVLHMDFYRLDELSQSDCLLFGEYLDMPDTIKLVEWANKFLDQLVAAWLAITITMPDPVDAPEERVIHVATQGTDARYQNLLEALGQHEYADR